MIIPHRYLLHEVDVVVLLEQTADGLELRVVRGANQFKQKRLSSGECHVGSAF